MTMRGFQPHPSMHRPQREGNIAKAIALAGNLDCLAGFRAGLAADGVMTQARQSAATWQMPGHNFSIQ